VFRLVYIILHATACKANVKFTTLHCCSSVYLQYGGGNCNTTQNESSLSPRCIGLRFVCFSIESFLHCIFRHCLAAISFCVAVHLFSSFPLFFRCCKNAHTTYMYARYSVTALRVASVPKISHESLWGGTERIKTFPHNSRGRNCMLENDRNNDIRIPKSRCYNFV